MSLTFAMVAFGGLMIYAGWTNRSLWALATGNPNVAKGVSLPVQAGQVRRTATTAGKK